MVMRHSSTFPNHAATTFAFPSVNLTFFYDLPEEGGAGYSRPDAIVAADAAVVGGVLLKPHQTRDVLNQLTLHLTMRQRMLTMFYTAMGRGC